MASQKRKKKIDRWMKKHGIEVLNTWEGNMIVNGRFYPTKEGWKKAKESLLTFGIILGVILLTSLLSGIGELFK